MLEDARLDFFRIMLEGSEECKLGWEELSKGHGCSSSAIMKQF